MSDTATSDDMLPLVGEDPGNRSLWLGLGAICMAGLLLFAIMEGNRQSKAAPQIPSPRDYAIASAQDPKLALPESNRIYATGLPRAFGPFQPGVVALEPAPKLPLVRLTKTRPSIDTPFAAPLPIPQALASPLAVQSFAPDPGRSAPAIVYDAALATIANVAATNSTTTQATKAMAVAGGDRTYLVSQGTLIFAVLETAMDSTQSGQVRAMISTNVYNALGTQILIPKGSRIFGEYKGELGAGQNRAQVIWTRLIRPDGATIALDSPASDQLGRAGVKGSVDTHFGERLLSALLQSTIDFGTYAASRAVTNSNGVVVALPNAAQSAGSQILPEVPKPTLRVRHGTRIAVFVSRDLDFSAVE
jgi:type IV secretion system protein VirB10